VRRLTVRCRAELESLVETVKVSFKYLVLTTVVAVASTLYFSSRVVGQVASPPADLITFGAFTTNKGVPESGAHQVAVTFYRDATATDPSFVICTIPETKVTSDATGFFTLPLPSDCNIVFRSGGVAFYELKVDGDVMTPRIAVGSVPFAVHAATAGSLVRGGATRGSLPVSTSWSSGTVCGTTDPTTGAFVDENSGTTGAAAGKSLCEAACNSSTAHICILEDLNRQTLLLGTAPVGSGWVANTLNLDSGDMNCALCGGFGGLAPFTQGPPTSCTFNGVIYDNQDAQGRSFGPGGPAMVDCGTVQPILCCD
jgi:hypothetical protein